MLITNTNNFITNLYNNNVRNVKQLISIMLVGTDVCIPVVFVWEETGVPGGNPPVWVGDHMTISHADAGYRTRVVAVRGECVNTAPARQPCHPIDNVYSKNVILLDDMFVLLFSYFLWCDKTNFLNNCVVISIKCFFHWNGTIGKNSL